VSPSGDTQWDPPVSTSSGSGAAAVAIELTNRIENPMRQKMKEKRRHHARVSTQLPDDWTKHTTEEGDRYYMDSDGLTQWEAPKGATGGSTGIAGTESILNKDHTRSETQLPDGWGKDFTDNGEKFYYGPDGATTWDVPDGATGGSTGK
jgi:hypothetical protein